MDVRIQELPFEPAALRGLSDKLLRSHHQNDYGGAVKRLNAIRDQLATLDFATALYFGSLGGIDGWQVAGRPLEPKGAAS